MKLFKRIAIVLSSVCIMGGLAVGMTACGGGTSNTAETNEPSNHDAIKDGEITDIFRTGSLTGTTWEAVECRSYGVDVIEQINLSGGLTITFPTDFEMAINFCGEMLDASYIFEDGRIRFDDSGTLWTGYVIDDEMLIVDNDGTEPESNSVYVILQEKFGNYVIY